MESPLKPIKENEALHPCYVCGHEKAAADHYLDHTSYRIYVHLQCLVDAGWASNEPQSSP